MRLILFLILFLTLLNAQTVRVAVAANLSYAITKLQKSYSQEHPKSDIQIILGSTGKLTALIKNGAPYDILMGADMAYPKSLYKDAFAIKQPRIYAKGSLILYSPKTRDFSRGIAILTDTSIQKIALANPQTAPYGKATFEALKRSDMLAKVEKKLIYAQSASQAVTYTFKVADIGFIPMSTLYSPQMQYAKKGENWIAIPKNLYEPIEQGIILLKHAKTNRDAQDFYNFLLSSKAKEILKRFGYSVE